MIASGLFDRIENEVNLDYDDACKVTQTLWLQVDVSITGNDDFLFLFIECLELIKPKANRFVYKLAATTSNKSPSGKKLLCVIWQTATIIMRGTTSNCFGTSLVWTC